jgi:steroid delta-isomerase-like uncharacterized protein
MSEAREVLDRAIRLWNDHDYSGWMELFSDDVELSAPGFEGSGSEALRMTCSLWKDAFPDNQSRVTSTYVEGDTVVQQAVFEGTHTGTFNAPEQAPIEATNKKLALRHVNICTVRNGKVKSWALYFDRADLMDQLGAGG